MCKKEIINFSVFEFNKIFKDKKIGKKMKNINGWKIKKFIYSKRKTKTERKEMPAKDKYKEKAKEKLKELGYFN